MYAIQCLASSISISILSYVSLCQLHGEHGKTIAWMAGRPPPWFHFFAGTAKPNRLEWGRASKIKEWHQVIETILYTSGTNPNLVTLSAEKEIIPCYRLELQESNSGVILLLQKHLAFSQTDSKACDYKV